MDFLVTRVCFCQVQCVVGKGILSKFSGLPFGMSESSKAMLEVVSLFISIIIEKLQFNTDSNSIDLIGGRCFVVASLHSVKTVNISTHYPEHVVLSVAETLSSDFLFLVPCKSNNVISITRSRLQANVIYC